MRLLRTKLISAFASTLILSTVVFAASDTKGEAAKPSADASAPAAATADAKDAAGVVPPTDEEVAAMAAKDGAKLTSDGVIVTRGELKELAPDLSETETAIPVGAVEPVVTMRGGAVNGYIFVKPQNVLHLGHIGWGYYAPNMRYFVAGSTENYSSSPYISAGRSNGFWAEAFHTEAEMFAKFKGLGYYAFKRKLVSSPNPDLAWGRAMYTRNNGFRGVGWNCLDHTYYVLEGFGMKDMPWKQTNPAPNGWFNAFPGIGYRLP